MKHYLILLVGLLGSASSVFFIKDSALGPATLAAVRTLLSSLILLPLALRSLRARGHGVRWDDLRAPLPGAVLLALHYTSWFVGVRGTSSALSALIVNLIPVIMPFLIWLLLGERINGGEILGTFVAMVGVAVLFFIKDGSGQTTTRGVVFCVVSIALCAGYLAMGRRFGHGRNIFAYIVPLYAVAGLICATIALTAGEPLPPIDQRQVLIALGAVIFPTVIGHTALNHAMAHLPSQVVSISNLLQFAFVAVMAVPIRHEYPSLNLAWPAALVLAGALVVIRTASPRMRKTIDRVSTEPAGT